MKIMQARQIKMIAQCCAFLVGCFCGGEALAEIKDYNASVTLDIIKESAQDSSNNNFMITLPEREIASRTKKKKYILKDEISYSKQVPLNCGNHTVTATLNITKSNLKSGSNQTKALILISPTLTLDSGLINKTGIQKCSLTNTPISLQDLATHCESGEVNMDITLNIAPYILITNNSIDAELTENQDSGDYTKQVEIPVETNANNVKLTLFYCDYYDGTTCQLKHERNDHNKIPIHINDMNNDIKIGDHISKSGFANINNTFLLDLKTKQSDMDNAKAGKYVGKINLKLEASF
ncbi:MULTISPECIES: hypothetical protein [Cysteiniphilum]|uniref:Uncharacterized protein n=1 Tax=Cysteiniphilum litorale TaxID=2056700 RepID=A0A8J2Z345_9GAMM|nr:MULTISPECIES: hypothetical protein [Cysteiniphilum]GGF93587.1 hypothetical protein GCM10010995_08440 [Cysteiniphilum litorale]